MPEKNKKSIETLVFAELTNDQSHQLKSAIAKYGITNAKAVSLTRHALQIADAHFLRILRNALNGHGEYESMANPGALFRNLVVGKTMMMEGEISDRLFGIKYAAIVDERIAKLKTLNEAREVLQTRAQCLDRGGDGDKASEIGNSPEFKSIDAQINELCVQGFDDQSSKTGAVAMVLARLVQDIDPSCELHSIRKSSAYEQEQEMYDIGAYFGNLNKKLCPWICCVWPCTSDIGDNLRIADNDLPVLKTILEVIKPSLFLDSTSIALECVDRTLRRVPAEKICLQSMTDEEIEAHLQTPEGLRFILLRELDRPLAIASRVT